MASALSETTEEVMSEEVVQDYRPQAVNQQVRQTVGLYHVASLTCIYSLTFAQVIKTSFVLVNKVLHEL